MVDFMYQSFLIKPEVLTPNRNGFMAKKCKWHLKAGSTVYVCKVFFYDTFTRASTITLTARDEQHISRGRISPDKPTDSSIAHTP